MRTSYIDLKNINKVRTHHMFQGYNNRYNILYNIFLDNLKHGNNIKIKIVFFFFYVLFIIIMLNWNSGGTSFINKNIFRYEVFTCKCSATFSRQKFYLDWWWELEKKLALHFNKSLFLKKNSQPLKQKQKKYVEKTDLQTFSVK